MVGIKYDIVPNLKSSLNQLNKPHLHDQYVPDYFENK